MYREAPVTTFSRLSLKLCTNELGNQKFWKVLVTHRTLCHNRTLFHNEFRFPRPLFHHEVRISIFDDPARGKKYWNVRTPDSVPLVSFFLDNITLNNRWSYFRMSISAYKKKKSGPNFCRYLITPQNMHMEPIFKGHTLLLVLSIFVLYSSQQ